MLDPCEGGLYVRVRVKSIIREWGLRERERVREREMRENYLALIFDVEITFKLKSLIN